jgi:protein required for attachment to host cells
MPPPNALAEPPHVWFVVADCGRGRLLKCSRVPPGRLHVEQIAAIEHHEEEHEHGRPSPRTGKSGNTYASGGHEQEHQLHRFAKMVVAWIENQAAGIDARSITLFAAPRFLGELRKLYSPAIAHRIDERQADLTQLSTAVLARHPAVSALLSG